MVDATGEPAAPADFMKLVRQDPHAGRPHQRRHARGRRKAPAVRRRGHRPVPHRAHVLRHGLRGAAVHAAQDDPQPARSRSARRPSTSCSRFVKARHQGDARGDGRPAGDDPPARSAAARVRAAGRGRAARAGRRRWASRRRSSRSAARRCTRSNPMMGHRGVRLGITYPEVTEMQVRAILEAAAELIKAGKKPHARDHDPGHLRRERARAPRRRSSTACSRRSQQKFGHEDVPCLVRHDDRDPAGRACWPTRWPRRPSSSPSAPTT